MKITLSEYAGFCPGVRRADDAIRKAISEKKNDELICTIGPLIHNTTYIDTLRSEGVAIVEAKDIEDIVRSRHPNPTTVFIRTHGIESAVHDHLLRLRESFPSLSIRDMTCPFVKSIHKIALEKTNDSTIFLLFCNPTHAESVGIMSYARGEKLAFSSLEELQKVDLRGKTPIICAQTTQNLLEFKKIKKFFKKLYTNAVFFDTICSVTENRQTEAIRLAELCDTMIVIGDKASSNTTKLYSLCRERCPNSIFVETAKDIPDSLNLQGQNVGITAGASTPDVIIMEVFKAMEEKFNDFGQMLEGSLKTLHTGDTVTGTVFTISENEIKLDFGTKVTGVLVKEQISDDPSVKLSEMFKIGDEVNVFVIRVDDKMGLATVSKKRVDADNSWVLLKDAYENGEVLEGKVISVVKGGVLFTTGANTVFIPASQTGIAKGGDLSALVGTQQRIKLLEYDVAKKKALGSIKVILNAEKKAKEEAVWSTLEVGQHFMGTVKNLTAYGAFVDIGGVDGMVHNSELSWKRIKHPSQIVSVGQQIDVFIKELDIEKKRISLGYKTQEMDSWFQFTQKFNVGDVVPAKIVSIMPFGAFAEVYEDVDGLIHISRISTERINSPADVLKVGDVVDVKITEIDDENRKLALSIRALKEAEEKAAREAEREAEMAARAAEKAERDAERAAEEERLAQERADMAPYIVGSID